MLTLMVRGAWWATVHRVAKSQTRCGGVTFLSLRLPSFCTTDPFLPGVPGLVTLWPLEQSLIFSMQLVSKSGRWNKVVVAKRGALVRQGRVTWDGTS